MSILRCDCCGKEFDWPPLDYGSDAPWKQYVNSDDEFESKVHLGRDDCVIDNRVFLLRGNVDIPFLDAPGKFAWGVWCSVKDDKYDRICRVWHDPNRENEEPVFAWLLTTLPCYPVPTAPVKAMLHLRPPGAAPFIEVDPDHPLGREQREGITMDRVREFARAILGSDESPKCPRC